MEPTHERKEHRQELSDEKQLMLLNPPTVRQPYPWLLISDGKDQERQTFFSISEDRFYTRAIPEMRNKVIICTCNNGWLVLRDLNSMNVCLLNPTSKETVHLPPLEDNDGYACILSSLPSNHNHQCQVVFINAKCVFYFCRLGDAKFDKQVFETEMPLGRCDMLSATFFGGKIYFIVSLGFAIHPLFIAEFVDSEIRFTKLGIEEYHDQTPQDIISSYSYLIESCGEILLLEKMMFGIYRRNVFGFLVFRMDLFENKWVQVKNIGERTIFLSRSGSSISTCSIVAEGVKQNAIYFTKYADRYLYVFDLEDDTISKSLPCPIVACQRLYLDWVMLS
ncbi:hypothetical protein ACB092_09G046100 [Castanea dentata]